MEPTILQQDGGKENTFHEMFVQTLDKQKISLEQFDDLLHSLMLKEYPAPAFTNLDRASIVAGIKLRTYSKNLTFNDFVSAMHVIGLRVGITVTPIGRPVAEPVAPKQPTPMEKLHQKKLEKSVQDLVIEVRVENCLMKADINTIGQLVSLTDEQVLAIPGIGPKALENILLSLSPLELCLRADPEKEVADVPSGKVEGDWQLRDQPKPANDKRNMSIDNLPLHSTIRLKLNEIGVEYLGQLAILTEKEVTDLFKNEDTLDTSVATVVRIINRSLMANGLKLGKKNTDGWNPPAEQNSKTVIISKSVLVQHLAKLLNLEVNIVLKALAKRGYIYTPNHALDYGLASCIARDLGFEPKDA